MTRNKRTKASLEQKVTELYIRANSRKTTKLSRKLGLQRRYHFYRNLLMQELQNSNEMADMATLNKEATETATKAGVESLPIPQNTVEEA
jgi:hypothetical protein